MAILASFVGIDRYQDPSIRELTGARRDATALWALFSDSIPDLRAELLVDSEATKSAVENTLAATLGAAGPEDTVLISFAGHGSRSHRLLIADTDSLHVAATSISMGELAELFRTSQAKFILCILDCCFAGGANARVFEDDGLIPRDMEVPLTVLVQGKGRLLIAASNTNESAFEHPTARHGLLTQALLHVFQECPDSIDLQTAASKVMDLVRAEAARMGEVQVPMVYLGQIEGGMTLPRLRPGPRYEQAFPEIHGLRVSNDIGDLAAFGVPAPVLSAWAEQFAGGLNDLQMRAVNDHHILDGRSLLVVAPTSSGKTFVGEMAAVRAITNGRKAVFLLPYKALTSEKFDQFDALYGGQLGMRVIRCTGDYLDQADRFTRGKYDLALLTYEMFLGLAVGNATALSQVGLIVVDEAQFLSEPKRGITVELLLTLLIAARERGIAPQIVALSAVIGGINHLDSWLGCDSLITYERPVKLVEGVLDHDGVYQYKDTEGNTQRTQLIPRHLIHQRKQEPGAQDVIVPLVRQLMTNPQEKVIVFRNMRDKARACASYLAESQGLPPATEAIALLPQSDLSSDAAVLRTCLRGGTAFHNADLNRDERAVVERAFRAKDNTLRVLAATTTVAAGINTPASVVILADHTFVGEDKRDFTVAEYRNMSGRAGRLGYQEEGRSMLYAATSTEREHLYHTYVMGQPEPMGSSFKPEETETWLLRLLAQVPRVPEDQALALLANTYGGYLRNVQQPTWRSEFTLRLEHLFREMVTCGLIEQYDGFIQLTPIGRACGRSTLAYTSCIRLIQLLRAISPDSLTHERLMALVQNLPESDGGYTTYFKGGKKEAPCPQRAVTRYGRDIVELYQQRAPEFEYQKRTKRACILGDWIDGVSVEVIEERYNSNPFRGATGHADIRRYADNTRYHLRAAYEIACLVHLTLPAGEDSIEVLLKQLEVGIPASATPLLDLPISLARGQYMALLGADLRSPDQVWATDQTALTAAVGVDRATELWKLRP